MLTSINAPFNGGTIGDARVQILLAKAEAQATALLMAHPLAAAAGDPLSRLIDDDVVVAIRTGPSPTAPTAPATDIPDCPYLTIDKWRFSDIIEPTIAAIQRSGDWNEDTPQRRTAMRAFAWITGDKRLCDYLPEDAELFARTRCLQRYRQLKAARSGRHVP